ncbi:hypothetical protein OWV82_014720 [Melia azedarach]|uniref:Uncharacterized protein n=1 Tax=Melia azedarach TaxID=155640 RepID=A0ACC1XM51_MELAZ|nr:hypothetical protein OWV82_014720 [Melia azedarach]
MNEYLAHAVEQGIRRLGSRRFTDYLYSPITRASTTTTTTTTNSQNIHDGFYFRCRCCNSEVVLMKEDRSSHVALTD